jgi:hypothetical protein
VNTPVCGGLGMFWVGDTDGAVVDCPVVVVGAALDVVVVVVVEVEGLLLALLPHAVSTPAAMIVTAAAAAAMRPAVDPDVISVFLSSTDRWAGPYPAGDGARVNLVQIFAVM